MKKKLILGSTCCGAFILWTLLIQIIDVQDVGLNGTDIGFATLNIWFHELTGVHMEIYTITDWLGLVPILVCLYFAGRGLVQLIRRKSLLKVDRDIIFLGIYYVVVILGYLLFEMVSINYRPILIDGFMEASYPSSTTLLVLSVMPTAVVQGNRRLKNKIVQKVISSVVIAFSSFMVIGRMISGVHWLSDIVGALLLGLGVFWLYVAAIEFGCRNDK